MNIKIKSLFSFILILLFSISIYSQDSIINSQIGIALKTSKGAKRLKAHDRLKSGDEVRVYIKPLQRAHVYAIYSDNNTCSLLNSEFITEANKCLVLPTEDSYYKFDNKSDEASFHIFCSKNKIEKIEEIFKPLSEIPIEKWAEIEKSLSEKNKSDITEKTDKPFTMAGNVRGETDPFLGQLRMFTGNGMIMKKYEFEIKK